MESLTRAGPTLAAPASHRSTVVRVAGAFAFRFACFGAMIWMALLAEARPAPSLPDAVLAQIPYVEWVDRYNYVVWLLAYVPVGLAFLRTDVPRFCRYMVSAGLLALVRGLCILATGLGPVHGADINAGMDAVTRWRAFWQIVSPIGVFARGSANVYLTKDLFFSGHVSTTVLMMLYVWPYRRLRVAMGVGHVVVLATVFLAHLHYTIDVVGAYAIAFTLYCLRELNLPQVLAGTEPSGP